MIRLQEILLIPLVGEEQALYLSGSKYAAGPEGLILSAGGELDFFSYFNLFSWDNWQQYTGISSLYLSIQFRGTLTLEIESSDVYGNKTGSFRTIVSGEGCRDLEIPLRILSGRLGLKVFAGNDSLIQSAAWGTRDVPNHQPVHLVGIICTFNRDEYLFRNLRVIREKMPADFEVMVVDNGSRIAAEEIDRFGKNFRLFSNPNTGGSGGFTRGILEALKSHRGYTHALVMDDDIRLEPDSIARTITLMRYLKPEYRGHFVSGAMLLGNRPGILFESTASWNGFRVTNHKRGLNLLDRAALCSSDATVESSNMYAAWWYCAFPLTKEMNRHLPFPFFIYGDDMDFSFSHASGFITLNGIGVWHEPFHRKFSPLFKSYFFCRNTLIVNALHPGRFSIFHSLLNFHAHFYTQLFVHDYRSADLVLEAVTDFLEGAEYLTALTETEFLKRKSLSGEFCTRGGPEQEGAYSIPANFKRFQSPRYFMHKRLVVGLEGVLGEELRKRSWKDIFSRLARLWVVNFRFLFGYHKASGSYQKLERSDSFWLNRFKSRRELPRNQPTRQK